jgi:hypothetical protein
MKNRAARNQQPILALHEIELLLQTMKFGLAHPKRQRQ